MNFKFELNEIETLAVHSISDTYKYITVMKQILNSDEIRELELAIQRELAKFKDPEVAELVHILIKAAHPDTQRTMLWHLPIKVKDQIIIKDSNHNVVKQGTVTANPSGSNIPYDEPTKNIDAYVYNLDGIPFVMDNEEHWVEIKGLTKHYRVSKKIYWG